MAVSQDVQDFCTQLQVRVQAAIAAAVAAEKATYDDLVTQMQQDHADEIAALKGALDNVAPAVAGG